MEKRKEGWFAKPSCSAVRRSAVAPPSRSWRTSRFWATCSALPPEVAAISRSVRTEIDASRPSARARAVEIAEAFWIAVVEDIERALAEWWERCRCRLAFADAATAELE